MTFKMVCLRIKGKNSVARFAFSAFLAVYVKIIFVKNISFLTLAAILKHTFTVNVVIKLKYKPVAITETIHAPCSSFLSRLITMATDRPMAIRKHEINANFIRPTNVNI